MVRKEPSVLRVTIRGYNFPPTCLLLIFSKLPKSLLFRTSGFLASNIKSNHFQPLHFFLNAKEYQ